MAHNFNRPEVRLDITIGTAHLCEPEDIPSSDHVITKIHKIYERKPWIQDDNPKALVSYVSYVGTTTLYSLNVTFEIELTFASDLHIKDRDRTEFEAMNRRIARKLCESYEDCRVAVTVLYATVFEETFTNPAS